MGDSKKQQLTEEEEDLGLRQSIFQNASVLKKIETRIREPDCLFVHQLKALDAFRTHVQTISKPSRMLIHMPTGTGKSAICVLAPYLVQSQKTLVITPSKIVSDQLFIAFTDPNYGILAKRNIPRLGIERRNQPSNRKVLYPEDPSCPAGKDIKLKAFTKDLLIMNAQKVMDLVSITKAKDLKEPGYDLVIVDEAHHSPASTWARILDVFDENQTNILFLTATPMHNGKPILQEKDNVKTIFTLTRKEAVDKGIIRDITFDEDSDVIVKEIEDNGDDQVKRQAYRRIAQRVRDVLLKHDSLVTGAFHQALVTVKETADANTFVKIFNDGLDTDSPERAAAYHGGKMDDLDGQPKNKEAILARFLDDTRDKGRKFRVLVVCNSLREGFDHPNISVVAIAYKNRSKVDFSQFVGRALRINRGTTGDLTDPIAVATVISDSIFEQKHMFETLDHLAEESDELNVGLSTDTTIT